MQLFIQKYQTAAVQESTLQEAEIERLESLEERSVKLNSVVKNLQGRAHNAEARATRAETALVEDSAKFRGEISKLQSERCCTTPLGDSGETQ